MIPGGDEPVVEDEEDLKNDAWLKANYIEMVKKYPRQWIAVCDQKYIADGATLGIARTKAMEIVGDRKLSFYFIEPSGLQM